MMTDHVHEWEIILGRSVADCTVKDCRERLFLNQIVDILNEHAKLKRENKALKRYIGHSSGCEWRGCEGPQEGPVVDIGKCTCGLDALADTQEKEVADE